jgi:hypothetical protein
LLYVVLQDWHSNDHQEARSFRGKLCKKKYSLREWLFSPEQLPSVQRYRWYVRSTLVAAYAFMFWMAVMVSLWGK